MEFDGTEASFIHQQLYPENDDLILINKEKFKELYKIHIRNIQRKFEHDDLDELFEEEL